MIIRNALPLQRSFALAALFAASIAFVTGVGCGGGSEAEPDPNTAATVKPPPPDPFYENKPFDETGLLDILAVPDVEVLVDGKPAGKTPITEYKVSPGSHDITYVDEVTGNRTLTIIVQPGEAKTIKTDRPPRAVDTVPE